MHRPTPLTGAGIRINNAASLPPSKQYYNHLILQYIAGRREIHLKIYIVQSFKVSVWISTTPFLQTGWCILHGVVHQWVVRRWLQQFPLWYRFVILILGLLQFIFMLSITWENSQAATTKQDPISGIQRERSCSGIMRSRPLVCYFPG